jgi:hypothetical protein
MAQFIAKFSTVAVLGLAVLPALGLAQAARAETPEPAVLARIRSATWTSPAPTTPASSRPASTSPPPPSATRASGPSGWTAGRRRPAASTSATRCSPSFHSRNSGLCVRSAADHQILPPSGGGGSARHALAWPFHPSERSMASHAPSPKGRRPRLPPIHHGLGTRSCGVSPDFAPSQAVGDTPRGHVPGWGVDAQRIANRVKRNQSLELFRPFLSITLPAGRIMLAPESTGRAHVRRPLRLSGVDEREALAGGL